jgi:hypothetical protein
MIPLHHPPIIEGGNTASDRRTGWEEEEKKTKESTPTCPNIEGKKRRQQPPNGLGRRMKNKERSTSPLTPPLRGSNAASNRRTVWGGG